MTDATEFHEGERAIQRRAGEESIAARNGAVIGPEIPKGAIPFLSRQAMAVVGSVDADGTPRASALFGRPGFMVAPDARTVVFDLAQVARDGDDPMWSNLDRDPRLGLLAIELASRRRLRVNGTVSRDGTRDGGSLVLAADEAYPNCPKYIQRRNLVLIDAAADGDGAADGVATGAARSGTTLEADLVEWVGAADTLFVASLHPERGADVSHRGGHAGFVQVLDEGTLRIPDYAGNSLFNTLGNFASHPRAGLLFLDFEGGRLLQLSGTPTVRFDQDDPDGRTGGTRRLWDLAVDGWRTAPLPAHLRWEFLDASPFNPDFAA